MSSIGEFIIKDASISEVKNFLSNAGNSLDLFRYFGKRPINVIDNHVKTLIVKKKEQVIGYGHLDPEKEKLWLGICVAERFKGKGIGRMILEELLDSAKYLNHDEIWLSVDNDNFGAITLYEKFGFRLIESRHNIQFMKLSL
ncbi:GNAT family N-acetyltransferase [Ekhidna sp.]|uniref:GNAT family N-acetyltransferase n=1 Tax=Ekhidna sp. TaxID=2608089 RepID=UPI0032969A4C